MTSEEFGKLCAQEAVRVAGNSPTDCNGKSLLPSYPQEGDWAAFLSRNEEPADPAEHAAFVAGYRSVMEEVTE